MDEDQENKDAREVLWEACYFESMQRKHIKSISPD